MAATARSAVTSRGGREGGARGTRGGVHQLTVRWLTTAAVLSMAEAQVDPVAFRSQLQCMLERCTSIFDQSGCQSASDGCGEFMVQLTSGVTPTADELASVPHIYPELRPTLQCGQQQCNFTVDEWGASTTGSLCSAAGPFELIAGCEFGCGVSEGGHCITDGPNNYPNFAVCSFNVTRNITLSAHIFDLENGYDFLTVGAESYTGTTGPNDIHVTVGTNISFTSDQSQTRTGFVLCEYEEAEVALSIEAGSEFGCAVSEDGQCITDGRGDYENNVLCVFRANRDLVLNSVMFETEVSGDFLEINGSNFSGYTGPESLFVAAGSNITFTSDGAVTRSGFTLCSSSNTSTLVLMSGSNFGCAVTNEGQCISDGPGDYQNDERCLFLVTQNTTLTSRAFRTEGSYDFLTIDGHSPYSATNGPLNLPVAAGTFILFTSDSSNTHSGFLICTSSGLSNGVYSGHCIAEPDDRGVAVIPSSIVVIAGYPSDQSSQWTPCPAFSGCINDSPSVLIVSDHVQNIGQYAFAHCSLQSVTIGNSVDSIGLYAFASGRMEDGNFDSVLRSVVLGDAVDTIWGYAFTGARFESVTLPDSLSSVGSYAFEETSLRSVNLPDSTRAVQYYAFLGARNLTSVSIPYTRNLSIASVTAFARTGCTDTSLLMIFSPGSVIQNCTRAFALAEPSSQIEFDPTLPDRLSVDQNAMSFRLISNDSFFAQGSYRRNLDLPPDSSSIRYSSILTCTADENCLNDRPSRSAFTSDSVGAFTIIPSRLRPRDYVMRTTAMSLDGTELLVRTWSFTILPPFARNESVQLTFRRRIDNVIVPRLPSTVALNQSEGLMLPENLGQFFVNSAHCTNITFSLVYYHGFRPLVGDFLVDSTTGYIGINPAGNLPYETTLQYLALCGGGGSTLLANWSISVRPADIDVPAYGPRNASCVNGGVPIDGRPFDQHFTCDCSKLTFWQGLNCDERRLEPQLVVSGSEGHVDHTNIGTATVATYSRLNWATHTTYQLPPYNLMAAFRRTEPNISLISEVTYSLTFPADSPAVAQTFLISPKSGFIQFTTPNHAVNLSALLEAEVSGTLPATIATLIFHIQPADTDDPANGPNGRSCQNGASAVDSVEFDGNFRCNCSGILNSTTNCDIARLPVVASSSSSHEGNATTIGVVGAISIIAAIGIALAYPKLRARWENYLPTDFLSMQERILENVGIGQKYNIGLSEFGLSFTLAEAQDRRQTVRESSDQYMFSEAEKLRTTLARIIRKVKVDWNSSYVRVVSDDKIDMIFRRDPSSTNLPDVLLENIQYSVKRAGSRLTVDGRIITQVSLLLRSCIPREISRSALRIIRQVGEGAASAVHQALIMENKTAGIPEFLVAAKQLRPGSSLTRDDLATEAAIMALLDHPNVLQIVGVVSSPRTMPLLLLIQYCEYGRLDNYVRGKSLDEVPMAMRLSFCADIAAGMQYLSARRVVHRDLAGRNVLLDAALVCKVADFGMSVFLSGAGEGKSEYQKDYIRKRGVEVPIRWCAIEVLTEDKYSVESDVWAFGVTVWEIMSSGAQPYANESNLTLVAELIKAGVRLEMPATCVGAQYAKLMASCWRIDPQQRPSFAELYNAALNLGGAGSHGRIQAKASLPYRFSTLSDRDDVDETSCNLLGVSVHHIASDFVSAVFEAMKTPFLGDDGQSVSIDDPEQCTIWHAVRGYAQIVTANIVCPRDGKLGAAYVNRPAISHSVGLSSALLSYTWAYKLSDVASALMSWVAENNGDPTEVHVWICALCLNQHRLIQTETPEQLAAEFGNRVRSIGLLLPMLAPWDDPVYVKRAWCLFELWVAIQHHGEVEISIVLPPSQRADFEAALATGGYGKLEGALDLINSVAAEATQMADLLAFRQFVSELPGGFHSLDETVRLHLLNWAAENGAVTSAPRVAAARRHGSLQRAVTLDDVHPRLARTSALEVVNDVFATYEDDESHGDCMDYHGDSGNKYLEVGGTWGPVSRDRSIDSSAGLLDETHF